MKKIFLLIFITFTTLIVISQKLTMNDLIKLKSGSLNSSESFLLGKAFYFIEIDKKESSRDVYFGYNLDENDEFAEEFVVLSFDENNVNPFLVWYQLSKDSWTKLRRSAEQFGFRKTKTESESDGSLMMEYTNGVYNLWFNTGKDNSLVNKIRYTITIHKVDFK